MKIAIAAAIFSFILLGLTFLYSTTVYGFSPQLKTEFLSKEIQNYIYYGPYGGSNKTLNYLQQSSDLDRVYVTSNGTHLEIKFLFNDEYHYLLRILCLDHYFVVNSSKFHCNCYLDHNI